MFSFLRPDPVERPAFELYGAAVAQARHPAFYRALGVPDTFDGRFELIALHVALVLRALRGLGEEGRRLGQAVFDAMFADLDHTLREEGLGDAGIAKRIKEMAAALLGRAAAYDRGLETGDIAEALRRNLYGTANAPTAEAIAAMSGYIRREAELARPAADLKDGKISFGAPPAD